MCLVVLVGIITIIWKGVHVKSLQKPSDVRVEQKMVMICLTRPHKLSNRKKTYISEITIKKFIVLIFLSLYVL